MENKYWIYRVIVGKDSRSIRTCFQFEWLECGKLTSQIAVEGSAKWGQGKLLRYLYFLECQTVSRVVCKGMENANSRDRVLVGYDLVSYDCDGRNQHGQALLEAYCIS